MFVTRLLYLIVDGSHEDYWNKGFVSVLALNRLCISIINVRMSIALECLCGGVAITVFNMHAVHANFSCKCLQTCEIFKNI